MRTMTLRAILGLCLTTALLCLGLLLYYLHRPEEPCILWEV